MSGLAVIVVGPDVDRARTALSIVAAAAALGRDAALLFESASLATLPEIVEPLATALALGVKVSACATGLAERGGASPEGIAASGMVGFLAANPDAQLLAV